MEILIKKKYFIPITLIPSFFLLLSHPSGFDIFHYYFNFSDFENKITNYKISDKQKKVAIYCTGGIRCEKASYILKKLGYKNIVQLEGGIINYIRQNPNGRKWRGECFVFDDRITYEA